MYTHTGVCTHTHFLYMYILYICMMCLPFYFCRNFKVGFISSCYLLITQPTQNKWPVEAPASQVWGWGTKLCFIPVKCRVTLTEFILWTTEQSSAYLFQSSAGVLTGQRHIQTWRKENLNYVFQLLKFSHGVLSTTSCLVMILTLLWLWADADFSWKLPHLVLTELFFRGGFQWICTKKCVVLLSIY